jgi:hypothetical protein
VSLWILTVHLKKANAVRRNDAYYYFQEKFTTISVTSQAFSRALSESHNTQYFQKSGELYYLTSKAQDLVEGWISGKPVDSPNDVDNV